jgi:hypothetical protein
MHFYVFQISTSLEVPRKEKYALYFALVRITCSAHITLHISIILILVIMCQSTRYKGYAVAEFVEALYYKP